MFAAVATAAVVALTGFAGPGHHQPQPVQPRPTATYDCYRSSFRDETCSLYLVVYGPTRYWSVQVTTDRPASLVLDEQVVVVPADVPGNGGALGSGHPQIFTPWREGGAIAPGTKLVGSWSVTAPVRDNPQINYQVQTERFSH
ncbi:MAG: hypothetical protein WB974_09385 [Acidobacteriaceae bacterium]